jgi:gluconokinase
VASADGETTARGAALLALESLGALPTVEDANFTTGRTFAPHPEATATYRAAIARQQQLYTALQEAGLLQNRPPA